MTFKITDTEIIIDRSGFIKDLKFTEEEAKTLNVEKMIEQYFASTENRLRLYCSATLSKRLQDFEKMVELQGVLEKILMDNVDNLSADQALDLYKLLIKEVDKTSTNVGAMLPKLSQEKL